MSIYQSANSPCHFCSTMTAEKNIFVPLIINNVDVKLPEDALTFTPESFNASPQTKSNVIAQGTDIANCHAAVDSCARAFESWRATPPVARRTLILRLAELLRSKDAEILRIMQEEIHASSQWANINLEESILMIQETAALVTSPSLAGSILSPQDPAAQALIFVEPLGVILGIAPWNSPLILGFRACLPAIAAGNTAILKGSELSPRTHYFIASLFREAGFPPGVCNFLLHRGVDAATTFEEIVERHEVRKCNFTGSTPVGRRIASKAAMELKPCLMELGGKNFAVVLGDADVKKAAEMVCEGAFLNVSPLLRVNFSPNNILNPY
jgi:acyl-CoA reductase-like NAD-dependent aldehyde dehydrogenase